MTEKIKLEDFPLPVLEAALAELEREEEERKKGMHHCPTCTCPKP